MSPGCALDDWAAGQGAQAVTRLASLHRLLRSREGAEQQQPELIS
jgi:hypothetical protein